MESENNYVDIGGRMVTDFEFSHNLYGEGFYRFNVEVDRLSGAGDILPVTVSERIVDKNAMFLGQSVRINGQIRSYNNYVEEEGRNKLVLTIFARDIELIDTQPEDNPNDIYLDGYLCKPAIYRTTPFGREISDILLAVNRSYGKSDYIPCIAWGRNARYVGRLMVGDRVRLQGRMQSRIYQKKFPNDEIVEKTAYEVSISKVDLVQEGYEE